MLLQQYRSLIANADSANDKENLWSSFKRYEDNKTSLAGIYNLVLQQLKINYKSRNYNSALEAALFGSNIPESVFHNLKDTVYNNTDGVKVY